MGNAMSSAVVESADESEVKDVVGHEPAAPACPKCGATMVRRMAKKGHNAGQGFWGCSGFPKCWGKLKGEIANVIPVEVQIDDEEVPACPKCGESMVKRIARKGKNAGQEFWGCVSYPKGRG